MRTYGRIPAAQPVTYDLGLSSWSASGLSVTTGQSDPNGGTSAVLFTATGTSPATFSPGIAVPQGYGAYYSLESKPQGAPWVSFVLDYLDSSGNVVASDTFHYNYTSGEVVSSALNGATFYMTALQGWYTATVTLPSLFLANVVGTQLEYWPVGLYPGYVTYGASALGYAGDYTIVPYAWTEVTTDSNGYNDNVYLTTLAQVLQLNLGESPFYANYGIPQQQTIVTQVMPDFYVMQVNTLMAPYFASLIINRTQSYPPVYSVTAVTHNGAVITSEIAT